jgi:maltose O-acetyltransferase
VVESAERGCDDETMIRHFANLLLWILPPSRLFWLRRWLLRLSGIVLAPDACICGRGWIYGRGRLQIGAGTWFSPGVVVYTHLDVAVEIGDRCDVGPGVEFVTGSHLIGSAERRAGAGMARAIKVGSGCWIGAHAVILGGVTLGDGVVVAAGAVVTRSVPANVLCAGVPAIEKRTLP